MYRYVPAAAFHISCYWRQQAMFLSFTSNQMHRCKDALRIMKNWLLRAREQKTFYTISRYYSNKPAINRQTNTHILMEGKSSCLLFHATEQILKREIAFLISCVFNKSTDSYYKNTSLARRCCISVRRSCEIPCKRIFLAISGLIN